jgi:hypothetical protein
VCQHQRLRMGLQLVVCVSISDCQGTCSISSLIPHSHLATHVPLASVAHRTCALALPRRQGLRGAGDTSAATGRDEDMTAVDLAELLAGLPVLPPPHAAALRLRLRALLRLRTELGWAQRGAAEMLHEASLSRSRCCMRSCRSSSQSVDQVSLLECRSSIMESTDEDASAA